MTGTALSYFHRGGDTALLGGTIPEHFAEVCRQHGDAEAVVGGTVGRSKFLLLRPI